MGLHLQLGPDESHTDTPLRLITRGIEQRTRLTHVMPSRANGGCNKASLSWRTNSTNGSLLARSLSRDLKSRGRSRYFRSLFEVALDTVASTSANERRSLEATAAAAEARQELAERRYYTIQWVEVSLVLFMQYKSHTALTGERVKWQMVCRGTSTFCHRATLIASSGSRAVLSQSRAMHTHTHKTLKSTH